MGIFKKKNENKKKFQNILECQLAWLFSKTNIISDTTVRNIWS